MVFLKFSTQKHAKRKAHSRITRSTTDLSSIKYKNTFRRH